MICMAGVMACNDENAPPVEMSGGLVKTVCGSDLYGRLAVICMGGWQ